MHGIALSLLALAGFTFHADSFLLDDTCLNRCHGGFQSADDFPCQCNEACVRHNDCCSDYQTLCLGSSNSCQGRCHGSHSSGHACQCNSHCVRYGDCCSDYNLLCTESTPQSGTCTTMAQIGQMLWDSDINRLSHSDVITNYQTQISDGTTRDNSDSKFFTRVDESKLNALPTYSTFLNLLDNYDPQQTSSEHSDSHETAEVNAFLDAVLDTKVMAELLDFLVCQSKVTSKSDLRTTLKKIWFDFYRRSSRYAYSSTSGFEHVLVGEYKDSSTVSGFHSWLSFYQKEKAGHINYLGYVSRSSLDVVGAAFTWNDRLKTKGSFFVGTSPEFDVAIYTLCYLMHPNDLCRLRVNGRDVTVKTFDDSGHIATAYVM